MKRRLHKQETAVMHGRDLDKRYGLYECQVRAVAGGREIKVAQGEQTADQNQVRACC